MKVRWVERGTGRWDLVRTGKSFDEVLGLVEKDEGFAPVEVWGTEGRYSDSYDEIEAQPGWHAYGAYGKPLGAFGGQRSAMKQVEMDIKLAYGIPQSDIKQRYDGFNLDERPREIVE